MPRRTTPIPRPSRIVALLLVALAFLGLVYLRYAPRNDEVPVTSAAETDDLTHESHEDAAEGGNDAADGEALAMLANRAVPRLWQVSLPVGDWLTLRFRLRPGLGLGCHLSAGHASGGAAIDCEFS
jgi:hypothetical protein